MRSPLSQRSYDHPCNFVMSLQIKGHRKCWIVILHVYILSSYRVGPTLQWLIIDYVSNINIISWAISSDGAGDLLKCNHFRLRKNSVGMESLNYQNFPNSNSDKKIIVQCTVGPMCTTAFTVQEWIRDVAVQCTIDEVFARVTPAMSYELLLILLISDLTEFADRCFCGASLQIFFAPHHLSSETVQSQFTHNTWAFWQFGR